MSIATLPGARRRLPNKRVHEIRDPIFRGHRYAVGLGRFPDGSITEIFLDAAKTGNDLADAARDAAITISIALQFDTPAEAIRGTVIRGPDGEPCSVLGAVLDLLAQERAP